MHITQVYLFNTEIQKFLELKGQYVHVPLSYFFVLSLPLNAKYTLGNVFFIIENHIFFVGSMIKIVQAAL